MNQLLAGLLKAEFEARWPPNGTAGGISDAIRHALVPPGKLLRPLLLLHSALAVGGQLEQVLPAAVGLECVHAGSLIHDDVIDHDDTRRGRPSVCKRFGIGEALVAGNALSFAWFETLAECSARGVPDSQVLAALSIQAKTGLLVCQGAAAELAMAGNLATRIDDYLEMARLKTAVLTSAACRIGATLAGATPTETEALSAFGEALGIAFQIRDDLLPYCANPEEAGKPGDSDLRNLRPTLPVLFARDRATTEQRPRLSQVFAEGDVEEIRELVMTTGACTAAASLVDEYAARARGYATCLPDTPHRRYLEQALPSTVFRSIATDGAKTSPSAGG